MNTYVLLLRGINVGLKNRIAMSELKESLEKHGLTNVSTYIASGNVLVQSEKSTGDVQKLVEDILLSTFEVSELIKVLVLTRQQLQTVVDTKPKGFGDDPEKYYSDVIFLMDIAVEQAMEVFNPREGVDKVWPGKGVVYSQRLGELRTKSRLSKIVASPLYKSMTIRTWGTTTKLLELIKKMDTIN